MTHCPCEGCRNSVSDIDCRLNIESECRAGDGFEAWEPAEPVPPKPSRSEKILKWSAIVLVWIAYPIVLYKLYLMIFAR